MEEIDEENSMEESIVSRNSLVNTQYSKEINIRKPSPFARSCSPSKYNSMIELKPSKFKFNA